MVSASVLILEYLCPIAGGITANFMWTAAIRDTYKAVHTTGTLGDLNPLPWAFMFGNCFGWILYSVLLRNFFVYFANIFGLFTSIWLNLQAVKLRFNEHVIREIKESAELVDKGGEEQRSGRGNNTTWDQIIEKRKPTNFSANHEKAVILMVLSWTTVTSIIVFSKSLSKDVKQLIVGLTVNANLVFFYGAPLSTIWSVFRTGSSSSIHLPTMVTNTLNGVFWCAYGFAVMDLFILIPNGLGALLGFVQLCLRLAFPQVSAIKRDAELATPEGSV